MEDSIKPGEEPIGTPPPGGYGITSVRRNTTFMKTFFFEELAEKHTGKISFAHIYPGLVDEPAFYGDDIPLWFRIAWRVMKPLVSWYMTSPEVCGQVMVYLATQRYPAKNTVVDRAYTAYSSHNKLGGGAYAVGQRGDESKKVSWARARKNDTGKKVWQHTQRGISKPSCVSIVYATVLKHQTAC